MTPGRATQSGGNDAVAWRPGKLWSLWDIMHSFNAGTTCWAFAEMAKYAEMASAKNSDDIVEPDWINEITLVIGFPQLVSVVLGLTETKEYIRRLKIDFESPIKNKEFQYGLHHLMRLMRSELQKRKVLALDSCNTVYFRDIRHGVLPPVPGALTGFSAVDELPGPIFGEKAESAFPAAYMDMIEAGRCLALGRNNAAIYHLMCVAEHGLRVLAWDRRVKVKQSKKCIPLELAQWGEMIRDIQTKLEKIKKWRASLVREEATQFYTTTLTEVRAFNEGYRRHIAHSRAKLYENDETLALWGHVHRFMNKLAERMSEKERTPVVWKAKK